jgi:predicted GNAT family N-acyltransferase
MITAKIAQTATELEDCYRIRAAVFIDEQGVPAEIERDGLDASALHVLALAEGRAVGTARVVRLDQGKTAKIGRVAVLAPARGTGVGKLLMAAIDAAPELSACERFVLQSQTHALPFYLKLGYVPYGDEFLDAGIAHVAMSKRRPPGDIT